MSKDALTARDPQGRTWTYAKAKEQDSSGFWAPEYWAKAEDGETRHCDWSRFSHYEDRHFTIFVEAGFPQRRTIGPWSPEQIDALAQEIE